MFVRFFLPFIVVLIVRFPCLGQSRSVQFVELPVQFLTVTQSYPLLNPSFVAVDSGVNFVSGNKLNFGPFRIYRSNYLNVNFRVRASQNSGNNHGFGLAALTDKQGDFIHYNRLYFSYAYKIRFAQHFSVALGVSLGMVNHAIENSSITAGASVLAPDGNVGIWLYGRKSYLGLSMNQLFNSKLTPIAETSVLARHLNIIAGRRFMLTPNLLLKSSIIVRGRDKSMVNMDVVNQFLIQKLFSAGFNYKHHQGLVLITGLENIPFRLGKHLAGGWFAYYLPFARYVAGAPQTYEITLTYKVQ